MVGVLQDVKEDNGGMIINITLKRMARSFFGGKDSHVFISVNFMAVCACGV